MTLCSKVRMLQILVIFFTVCLKAQAGGAQKDEPWQMIGTWKLNIAKSKFVSPPPKSSVMTFERDGAGLRHTASWITDKGEEGSGGWIMNSDGEGTPLDSGSGVPHHGTRADHYTLKKINRYTSDLTAMKGGKVFRSVRRVVAKDGKSVSITITQSATAGDYIVEVFDKQ